MCLLGIILFVSACGPDEQKQTVYMEKGDDLMLKGEFAEAEQAFQRAIALDSGYGQAYVKLGIARMRQGHLKSAFASFSRAAEIDPGNVDIQLRLATFHMLARHFPEALSILDNVLLREPRNIEALFLKGSLMAQKKDLQHAKRLFSKIIEIDPAQVRAYLALIKTRLILGEGNGVIELLHGAIKRNPHALDLKLALVDQYLDQGEIADAKGILLDALQHDPSNPRLQGILGTFYFRIGQMGMAESSYREAVKLAPLQLRPLMNLARFYALTGDENKAAKTYTRALEIAPSNVQVLDTIARFFVHSGKPVLARKYVRMALKANPAFLPSRILDMELALEQGDFNGTLQISRALLEEGKTLPKIHYLEGMALLATGETTKAREALGRAVNTWPGFTAARLGLAKVLFELKEYRHAREQAEKVLEQSPDSLDARMLLGNIADARQRFNEAKKHYRQILAIDPGYAPAANNLAYIIVRENGSLDKALELATLASEEMPDDPLVLDTLGWIHLLRGDPDIALPILQQSVVNDPTNPIGWYHLGLAHSRLGDRLTARESLLRALDMGEPFQGDDRARELLDSLGEQKQGQGAEDAHVR